MTQTKNLPREALLTSFLSRASSLCSSGLQIDSDGYLYSSGEMLAAWQNDVLFIDCGSNKVAVQRQVYSLRSLAEKESISYIPYNEYSLPISREFLPSADDFKFVHALTGYPIWLKPSDVNPKNIYQQLLKTLDISVRKAVSFENIQRLIKQTQHIASLFSFDFDATQYTTQATQGALNARIEKQLLAQHHLQQYTRITKELETA